MSKIFVPAYWPMFKTSELLRFDYTDPTGSMPPITSVFAYDKGSDSMLYLDYDAHLTWKDTWYYRYNKGSGINEWRDDYPGKKVVMSPPIGWGEYIDVGSDYITYPQMSPIQSWPPAMAPSFSRAAPTVMAISSSSITPTATPPRTGISRVMGRASARVRACARARASSTIWDEAKPCGAA